MSAALAYIVVGCANILASNQPPNALPTASGLNLSSLDGGTVQVSYTRSFNYSHTPGVGIHRLNTRLTSWNNARLACEDQGGHLAIINSVAEAEAIVQMLNNSNIESAYVGVHDLYEEGAFVTIHGESLEQTGFEDWDEVEPNNAGGDENCVVLRSHRKLNDIPCSTLRSSICEVPYVHSQVQQNPTLRQPEHPIADLVQGPVPTRWEDYTYTPGIGAHKIFTGPTNWFTARSYCKQDGAHLAIINSVAEAEAISRLLQLSNVRSGWIGVHDQFEEGNFLTIHNQTLGLAGFDSWYPGEPNNAGGAENCVVLEDIAKMNDASCALHLAAICESPSAQLYFEQTSLNPAPATIAEHGNLTLHDEQQSAVGVNVLKIN